MALTKIQADMLAAGVAAANLGYTPSNVADGLSISGDNEYNATTTLTSANFGKVVYSNTTANTTLTLPSVTGNHNKIITISNLNTGIITVTAPSGGIYGYGKQGATSITVSNGDTIQLAVNGDNWKALTGGNRKLIKITKAFSSSTRVVYGNNTGTNVSGINFNYPTGGNQPIVFTKESPTSNIVIAYNMSVGGFFQTHTVLIWKSNDTSIYKRVNLDGGNGIGSRGWLASGQVMFNSLAAGAHTFYYAHGRANDGATTGYILNINATDMADKGGDTLSEIYVYEYES